jgi:hypothetical protein
LEAGAPAADADAGVCLSVHPSGTPPSGRLTFCPVNSASCYVWIDIATPYATAYANCTTKGGQLVSYQSYSEQKLVGRLLSGCKCRAHMQDNAGDLHCGLDCMLNPLFAPQARFSVPGRPMLGIQPDADSVRPPGGSSLQHLDLLAFCLPAGYIHEDCLSCWHAFIERQEVEPLVTGMLTLQHWACRSRTTLQRKTITALTPRSAPSWPTTGLGFSGMDRAIPGWQAVPLSTALPLTPTRMVMSCNACSGAS